MAGKNIGKLSIRVIPDTALFKEDLLKSIKRMENTMRMMLDVRADTDMAKLDLARFRNLESAKEINIRVKADVAAARASLAAVSKDNLTHLAVLASTSVAKTQMGVLARDRTVTLFAKVNQASFAVASGALARLSGFRIAHEILGDVTNSLKDIDMQVPKIARMALGITSLSAAVLQSSVGIITLSGDLAKMGNAAFVLPAALTGAAVGIVTLAMALKDSKKQLAQFAPAMHELQNSISSEFWNKAKEPIVNLVNAVLPSARAGFAQTAAAIGVQAGAIAQAFQKTLGGGVLDAMFLRLRQTIDTVTTGSTGFAEAITTIGTVGSNYLPQLAKWVVDVGNQFNSWLQGVAASGELDKFIQDGITQMQLFGSSIADIVRVFKGIDSAATAAGATGLANFAASMKSAADAVNAPAFQLALTTILQGANRGLNGLSGGFLAIGGMLQALAPQISTVFSLVGQTVGGLLANIAGAMDQPAFKTGLINFFAGIKGGVDALGPAMGPLFAVIGQLGTTIGALALNIGSILAAMKITFAPVIDALLVALTPLVPLIGGLLVGAINALAPVMQGLGSFISDNAGLVQGFVLVVGGLGFAISAVTGVMAAYQVVMGVVKAVQLGYAAATYGAAAATYVSSTASRAGAAAAWLVSGAQAIVSGALYNQVAAWVAQTGAQIASKAQTVALVAMYGADMVRALVKTVAGLVVQTGAWIANTAAQVASKAVLIAGAVAMGIATAAQWALNVAMNANPIALIVIAIAALVAGLVWFFTQTKLGQTVWTTFTTFLSQAWTNITTVFNQAITNIVAFVTANWGLLLSIIIGPLGLVIQWIVENWGAITQFFADSWTNIVAYVTTGIALVMAVIQVVGASIAAIWTAIWAGITAAVTAVWTFIVGFVTAYINMVVSIITAVGATIAAVWNAIWAGISAVVSAVWNAIVGIVTGFINRVSSVIGAVMSAIGSVWSGAWNGIRGAISTVAGAVGGIVSGMVNSVTSAVGNIGSAIGGIRNSVVGAVSGAGAWLADAGRSIVQGLIDGITGMIGKAKSAIGGVMTAIGNFLPHSPAKEGEFSGRGWTLYSGQAMGEGLVQGIDSRVAQVRRSAAAMMSAASGVARIGVDAAVASIPTTGAAGYGDSITVMGNVGYDPAAIAAEIDLKKKQAAMANGLSRVGVK